MKRGGAALDRWAEGVAVARVVASEATAAGDPVCGAWRDLASGWRDSRHDLASGTTSPRTMVQELADWPIVVTWSRGELRPLGTELPGAQDPRRLLSLADELGRARLGHNEDAGPGRQAAEPVYEVLVRLNLGREPERLDPERLASEPDRAAALAIVALAAQETAALLVAYLDGRLLMARDAGFDVPVRIAGPKIRSLLPGRLPGRRSRHP